MSLLWLIIIVLAVLWLFGWAGPRYYSGAPRTGGAIHVLIIIVVLLVILALLGIL